MNELINEKFNILWVDFMANGERLSDISAQKELITHAEEANISHLVIDAKIPFGFTTYPSQESPHVSEWSTNEFIKWKDRDFLQEILEAAKDSKIKVLANLDIFSEGTTASKDGKVYEKPEWEVTYYNDAVAKESNAAEYSDAQTIFVNPIHPEVIEYELNIIKEVCQYPLAGVVVDRCRYPNIYGDFSEISRKAFESSINQRVENWPTDIFTIDANKQVHFEKLFPQWIEWRAGNIKQFIQRARETVKGHNEALIFSDYVGSWYPLYYSEGLNWGGTRYHPNLEWTSENYNKVGFADDLDFLMTGCYYPEVTIDEARMNNRPADWYSVEGAAELSVEVVAGATPVIASLYLKDYKNNPEQFIDAVKMSKEKTAGVMLFDTIYLEDYKWWDLIKAELNT